MKTKEVELVSAKYMNEQYPETFEKPDEKDLEKVDVGVFVKVCAIKERFWLEVIAMEKDFLIGRIDNDLVLTPEHGLRYDDLIIFKKENIYSVML